MGARIDPTLVLLADEDPDRVIEAIISASGTLDALIAGLPASLTIQHMYRLVPGVAVSGPIGDIQALAESSFVRAIEPVRAVQHC